MEKAGSIEYLINQKTETFEIRKSEIHGQHLIDVIDIKSSIGDGNKLDIHPLEIDTGMHKNKLIFLH